MWGLIAWNDTSDAKLTLFLLQDETGDYFLCKNDENEEEPVVFYLEEKQAEDVEKTVVKMRHKTEEKDSSSIDSTEKELNGKRNSPLFHPVVI
jgi:hypothetical protein